MACIDCFDNCTNGIQTDRCVKYTGNTEDSLGICTGDSLYQVEAALIGAVLGLKNGTAVVLPDLNLGCQFLTTFFDNNDKTLSNYIQILLDRICYQDVNIEALNDIIFAPLTINAPCLLLPLNPTRDQVLVAVATKVCSLDTQVAVVSADYVKESELCVKVNACLTGSSSQYNTRMVPFVAYPYHGSISNFDAAGIGLLASGFDKVYICNGQTVGVFPTPDYRGRSPLGSNVFIPGNALDSAVDPSLPANAGYNITVGVKKGTYTDTLTVPQMPAHNHTITDPGHIHNITYKHGQADQNESGTSGDLLDNSGTQSSNKSTQSAITGISVNSSGTGQPHNTTHPVMGCNFIMYIP